jgi:hypothetical protein
VNNMANRDEMSFSRAFADARKKMGGGKTFTWRGNKYTTDLAEEPRSSGSRSPGRSTAEIARSASAAIDRAEEERRPRPNPRRDTGRTESPRPQANPRRSDVATSVSTPSVRAEPIDRRVRGAQDASPTRSAVTAAPASIQRLLDEAPGGAARAQAERIADQVRAGRMPLREAIDKINALFSGITSPMAGRNEELRQLRTATGMAKGGMVKKGNTDLRKKGMFYDSKSPRGYK